MKPGRRILLLGVCASLAAGSAMADPATIGIYRDTRGASCSFSTLAPGINTVHVVVHPDERGVRAVRFSAPVPSCFGGVWVTDIATERTSFIGNSQTGISVASGWCEEAPAHILDIQYMQSGSTSPCCEYPVLADPYVQMIEVVDCTHSSLAGTGTTAYFNANTSCLCGVNDSPAPPSDPSPPDGAAAISVFTGLAWSAEDPDSNLAAFDLYLGTGADPALLAAGLAQPSFQPLQALDELTTYYWRVVARDVWGASVPGPVWSFTTRLANSPPPAPNNPWPPMGMTGVLVTAQLEWQCIDIDGDAVSYDLYLGTEMSPPLVAAGLANARYSPSLTWDTYYYWRVVARDSHGHETPGPTWGFRTRPENWPPDPPSSPSPANGATFRPLNGTLTWACADRDAGDTLVYDVYFGPALPPPQVASNLSTKSYSYAGLAENSTYHWYIVARDNHGAETTGVTWSFTTQGNRSPAAPSSPAPSNGAANVSILATLGWTCTDPDNDALKYDVYFGTTSPPPLVASNHAGTSYSAGVLAFLTGYHWRIVARDPHGAETSGPTWGFATRPDGPPSNPAVPSPVNNATSVSVQPTLTWQCTENDGQPMTFDVYFGTSATPPQVASGLLSKSYTPEGYLDPSTRYYWRIVAHDNTGHQSTGATWSFTTRANRAPLAPSSPAPPNGGYALASTILSWSASDPDGQSLTYDVYLGDTSPPSLVAQGVTTRSYPVVLTASRKYYWKVAASDGALSTSGPVWSFTTLVPGDVDLDGWISTVDARCAMDQWFSLNCGNSVAANVDCIGAVTPRDARCIHRRALEMTCPFCGEGTAPEQSGSPGIGVLASWEWNDTLYCRLGVWNVPSFESFGFSIGSGPEFVRAQRRGVTNDWVVLRSRSYGVPWGGGRVGGYSLTGVATQPAVASEFVDLRFLNNGTYWVSIGSYTDDLAGAPDLFFELPQPGIPVLITRFDATARRDGVELSWQLQSDEAMESFTVHRRDNGSPPAAIAHGAVEGTTGRHLDASVSPGVTYEYELVVRTAGGDEFRSQVQRVTMAGLELALGPNHPNPFNPQTTIPYTIPAGSAPVRVRLAIYDTSGRLVRVLVDENQAGGARNVVWRGDGGDGKTVTSGVYFCVLQAGNERRTRKLVMLK